MRRLCVLVPDVDSARALVDDLHAVGVADANLWVVGPEGTLLGDLPDAGIIEKSDFYPQLERGLAMGAAVGVIGSLVAMRVAGVVLGGAAVVLFGLVGAGVNGLLSAIAGASFANSRLTQFEKDIAAGCVLIMVDTPPDRVAEIERVIKARHPEAKIEGFEPHAPVLPK
jgi:hypothetical protein